MRVTIRVLLLLAVAGAVAAAWRLGYFEQDGARRLAAAVSRTGETRLAVPLYAVAYVLVIVLVLPVTPLSLIGGALFGVGRAMLIAWFAALVGSALAYVLGRSIGRGPARRFLARHPMLRRLRDRIGLWGLLRLRVLPLAPFGVLDYVAGSTGVRLRTLLMATAIGILPTLTAYTYAGQQLSLGLQGEGEAARRAVWIAASITATMVLLSLLPILRNRLGDRG